MKIDIEVISKQMIKPSFPTPDHCRRYQLSAIDHLAPPIYVPLIYFFNLDDDRQNLSKNEILNRLKLSLSQVLTQYYPLAGCLSGNYIDCNDNGVLFLETKLSCNLSEFTRQPLPNDFIKLLLPVGHKQDDHNLLLGVQVNFFGCGGVAISVIISHKIGDGCTFFTYIKNWAASANDADFQCPKVFAAAADFFPPRDIGRLELNQDFLSEEKRIVFKRFAFSNSTLAALKEKYADRTSSVGKEIKPTRVQALSAFIWNRFAVSTEAKIGPESPWKMMHSVNLRKRMDQGQSLPDDSLGNIVWGAEFLVNDSEPTAVVKKLRNGISEVNKTSVLEKLDYIIANSDQILNNKQEVPPPEMFYYTSLCSFPLYNSDFGWGKPHWVAWGGLHLRNLVVLMDPKDGDGIETWIHLTDEDMAKFEADKEILAFASSTY